MKDRIKLVRTQKDLSQEKFAIELNLSRNFINQIESGKKSPSERTLKDICLKFGVNEEWLRTGEGEMFLPKTMEEELAHFTLECLSDEPESFRNRLVKALAKLSMEEWEVLEKLFREVSGQ